MTTSYFVPPANLRGNTVVLPEEEAHHAVRVLRARPGDEAVVVDGEGGWYRVVLETLDRRGASGRIVEARRDVGEPAYDLTIGLALLKNPGRFETFLEKAVELGVRRVIPLLTERTEKQHFKASRAENILVAAMKQCGRSRLVRLEEPRALEEVIKEEGDGLRLICHEQMDPERSMKAVLARSEAQRLTVLVGPEGGFTEEEIAGALERGYDAVSLGPRRLRAETAAVAAAAAVMLGRG